MNHRHLALAVAFVLLAAPIVHADGDGLPSPTAAAPRLDQITVLSGSASMTVHSDGSYTASAPVSSILDYMGISPYSHYSGKLLPSEVQALTDSFSNDGSVASLGNGGPLWDNQILSHEPISISITRTKLGKDGKPQQVTDSFESTGEPTPSANIVGAAGVLNGILDRVTNGGVYGLGVTMEGVVSKTVDSRGGATLYLTDDSGRRVALGYGDSYYPAEKIFGTIDEPAYEANDLASLVGTRVRVHGFADGKSGTDPYFVVTRQVEPVPGKGPSRTPGIAGALQAASKPE